MAITRPCYIWQSLPRGRDCNTRPEFGVPGTEVPGGGWTKPAACRGLRGVPALRTAAAPARSTARVPGGAEPGPGRGGGGDRSRHGGDASAPRLGWGRGIPAGAPPSRGWRIRGAGAEPVIRHSGRTCPVLPARQRFCWGRGRAATSFGAATFRRAARGTAAKRSEELSSHVIQVKQDVASQLFFLRVLSVVFGHSWL